MTVDRGPFLQTFSGRHFHPFDPRPDEIDVDDIAHALAHTCRWGGHTKTFFSVCKHAVQVSDACLRHGPRVAYAGLHHDDSEGFLCDVPRPLKLDPSMQGYRTCEATVQAAIEGVFGIVLAEDQWALVHDADNAALGIEARLLLRGGAQGWTPPPFDAHAHAVFLATQSIVSVEEVVSAYLSRHVRLRAELGL